ncbi:hypothetical protein [Cedecea sp. NFIX57]|uniref:hypothetical protein n=1 Tax=Cedecea sp. NFIX57 TaxID=1566286 RepID=UPI000A0B620B|nr:hypothetical protein [Cedecea sp. NFIX57]SMG37516.1 hypothetical protein SAMN03159353_1008194 [Cedecea sp. NFIX57]
MTNTMPNVQEIRRQVISGNWTAINNGDYTLTDLGLRHNGSGLVWAKSGVSVREADYDEGFEGMYATSDDYHAQLEGKRPLETYVMTRGVHAHKIDDLCFAILHRSGALIEYTHRSNGARLSTHAYRIPLQDKQQAFHGYYIFRNPKDENHYMVLHQDIHKSLVEACLDRGWSCESTYELSLVVSTTHEFGLLMRRSGYRQIQTRKITGKYERFWIYRSGKKDKSLLSSVSAISLNKIDKKVAVQASETERFAFKRVAVDGRYLWVYADHICFLRKIRTRVNGKRVQGYTAKQVNLVIDEPVKSSVSDNKLKNIDILDVVQAAETQYTPDILASMTPQDILSAAKNTLIQLSATNGFGMTAHNIMLSHGGRNLASVPAENMAGCLVDLDKLLVVARAGVVEVRS